MDLHNLLNRWITCYEFASLMDGPPVTGIPFMSRTDLYFEDFSFPGGPLKEYSNIRISR